VQGLAEFFPVSTVGHLVAIGRWIGARREGSGASFEAFLHIGTLLSCLVVFRREIGPLIGTLLAPRRLLAPSVGDTVAQDARFVLLGSFVTALGALPFKNAFEATYDVNVVLVTCLCVTAVLLLLSRWVVKLPSRPPDSTQALLVGAAQVLALLPGISRSGITIVVGLLVGIPLARVTWLSFLLSMPAILGGTLMELHKYPPTRDLFAPIVLGIVVAFVAGLFAVRSMLDVVPRGRMQWFALYVLAFAGAVAIWG
jgi:undecaprenyl-diphosphatase